MKARGVNRFPPGSIVETRFDPTRGDSRRKTMRRFVVVSSSREDGCESGLMVVVRPMKGGKSPWPARDPRELFSIDSGWFGGEVLGRVVKRGKP